MRRFFIVLFLIFFGVATFFYFTLPHEELRQAWISKYRITPGETWVGIIGDSSVTGAAAHPKIEASWSSLLGHAHDLIWLPRENQKIPVTMAELVNPKHYGIVNPDPVTRLYYGPGELRSRSLYLLNIEAKGAIKLDSEELSFGYLVGRRLGIPAPRIVIAGQDGAMLGTISVQLQRLLEVSTYLPPILMISFVANDLCDPLVFNRPVAEFAEAYRQNLKTQLRYLALLPADQKGTRVLLLPPLDLANILSNPQLLSQVVDLNGEQTTCGSLRESRSSETRLSLILQKVLIHECPAILESAQSVDSRLARIQELQAAQIAVLGEEVENFNSKAPARMKMQLAASVRDIVFQKGDLANDCFHPSAYGHARIANRLLANELRLDVETALPAE